MDLKPTGRSECDQDPCKRSECDYLGLRFRSIPNPTPNPNPIIEDFIPSTWGPHDLKIAVVFPRCYLVLRRRLVWESCSQCFGSAPWAERLVRPIREVVRIGPSPPDPSYPKPNPRVLALSKLPDLPAARLDSKKPRLLAAHRVLSCRLPLLFRLGRFPRYTTLAMDALFSG